MTYSKHEATAILADYGMESQDQISLALAGYLAIGADQDPTEAVTDTLRRTSLDRLSLYEWFDNPAMHQRIEERVVLQENFGPYASLAQRTESPLLFVATVLPYKWPSLGNAAIALAVRTPQGEKAVFKTPRKQYIDSEKRRPLTLSERVVFVEERIRKCSAPAVASYEQNIAASYRGSIISSHVPGKMLSRLSTQDMAHISDEQMLQAVLDLEAMAKAGVLHDTNGTNSVYDTSEGFGFFDAHDKVQNTLQWRLKRNIEGFAANLACEERVRRESAKRQELVATRTNLFWRLHALGNYPALSQQAASLVQGLEYWDCWNKSSN